MVAIRLFQSSRASVNMLGVVSALGAFCTTITDVPLCTVFRSKDVLSLTARTGEVPGVVFTEGTQGATRVGEADAAIVIVPIILGLEVWFIILWLVIAEHFIDGGEHTRCDVEVGDATLALAS